MIFLTGYIDVGGGMRDAYGAGVLDRLIDDGISFPYYTGVSAGSANIVSFLGNHRGRTLRFYRDYPSRKEYMGINSFIKTGSYLGLDYIYGALSNSYGEDPVSYETAISKECKFNIVATDAKTGNPVYFDFKNAVKDNYYEIKSSCCIPVFCKPYKNGEEVYFDGGVSDPIPVKKALSDGCKKIVVTLTLPKNYYKKNKVPLFLYKAILRKYPSCAEKLYLMAQNYNESLDFLKKLEVQGKALILAPDDCCGISTLTHKKENIEALYRKGYEDAEKVKEFLLNKSVKPYT